MTHWTVSDIPSQHGRTAVVTGTGGLGLQTAIALAKAGANVIVAGRNQLKGMAALNQISKTVANANVAYMTLDLASLASIEAFVQQIQASHSSIDILINNAAVMTPPKWQATTDGFELQFGTNYLGHFALTAGLLPLLRRGNEPRVVTVSSIAARSGAINFGDLQSQKDYKPMSAYSQSKLACLMFARELQRQSDAANWGIQSIASHPGISRTDLLINSAGPWSSQGMARRFLWFLFQPASQGALPTLFAATSAQANAGAYYGPDKLSELRGNPAPAKFPSQSLDESACARLWVESEILTGVVYPSDLAAESTHAGVPLLQ